MANICTSTLKIHANEKTMEELVRIFGNDLSLDVEQIVPTLIPEELRAKAFTMITGSDKIDGWAPVKTSHGTRQAPAWYLAGIMSGLEDKTWFFDALFQDDEKLKNHINNMKNSDFYRLESEIQEHRLGSNGFDPTDPVIHGKTVTSPSQYGPNSQNKHPEDVEYVLWYIDSNWYAPIGFVRQLSKTIQNYHSIEFSFIESSNNIGGVFVCTPDKVLVDKRHDAYINIPMDLAIERGLTLSHVEKYLKEPFSEWCLNMDIDDYEIDHIREKLGFIIAAVNQPVYEQLDDKYRIAMLLTIEMHDCCDYAQSIKKLRGDLETKFPLLTDEQKALADLVLPENACLLDVATIINGSTPDNEAKLPEITPNDISLPIDFLHVMR